MKFTDNVSLKELNTLAIDVSAKRLVEIHSIEDLKHALPELNDSSYLVLGGGSNVLLQQDYSGIVLHNKMQGVIVLSEDEFEVCVSVSGGEDWHEWVLHALKSGWHGLENLALIPGTVGAAPIQNIGAYGVEMASCCKSVTAMDLTSGEIKVYSVDDCQFGYRDSYFKRFKNYFILSVEFCLSKRYQPELKYAPLASKADNLGSNPTADQVVGWVCEIRQSKLPDPVALPNAGSFFKNPMVSVEKYLSLLDVYPDIVAYKQGNNYKLAAGWLIDKLGLKGFCQSGVCVHEQQALVLVNLAGSGIDVLNMASHIQAVVGKAYGVQLEIEPRVV